MPNYMHPVVFVAALTYRRPEMLAILLENFLALEHPSGYDTHFLIVDNDASASARHVVESFAPRFGEDRLVYVVEPEPGIPFGRNRALREATDRGAKLLAFIDDDEYPDAAWLHELVAHHRQTGVVLVGGPVRLLPPDYPIGKWRRLLARSLIAHNAFVQAWSARRFRQGRLLVIATNNWLGDIEWINDMQLRFDPALCDTAGDDAAFFVTVQARGGKVSWCERAIVNEHLPPGRLSVSYQFKRYRGFGITAARLGRSSSPDQLMRMLGGLILIVVPVLGWASPMIGLHMLGTGVGWFAGLRGARSYQYARGPGASPGDNA